MKAEGQRRHRANQCPPGLPLPSGLACGVREPDPVSAGCPAQREHLLAPVETPGRALGPSVEWATSPDNGSPAGCPVETPGSFENSDVWTFPWRFWLRVSDFLPGGLKVQLGLRTTESKEKEFSPARDMEDPCVI